MEVDGILYAYLVSTGYEDNSKFIVPRPRQQLFHEAKPREIIAVGWDKKLTFVQIVS